MKAIANSAARVTKLIVTDDTFTTELVERIVADDGGALRRTRVSELRAAFLTVGAVAVSSYDPPYVFILSLQQFAVVSAIAEPTLNDFLNNSTIAKSLGAARQVMMTPSDDSLAYGMASLGGIDDVVTPFTDYDALLCGSNFYIVTYGGAFSGDMRVTVDLDRVEISQDEYMKHFASSC